MRIAENAAAVMQHKEQDFDITLQETMILPAAVKSAPSADAAVPVPLARFQRAAIAAATLPRSQFIMVARLGIPIRGDL